MSRHSSRVHVVTVDLPEEAFQHRTWSPQEITEEMRRLWLLEEVRARRLGFGKAAELAGVPVATFLGLMGEHHITAFDYSSSTGRCSERSPPLDSSGPRAGRAVAPSAI